MKGCTLQVLIGFFVDPPPPPFLCSIILDPWREGESKHIHALEKKKLWVQGCVRRPRTIDVVPADSKYVTAATEITSTFEDVM